MEMVPLPERLPQCQRSFQTTGEYGFPHAQPLAGEVEEVTAPQLPPPLATWGAPSDQPSEEDWELVFFTHGTATIVHHAFRWTGILPCVRHLPRAGAH